MPIGPNIAVIGAGNRHAAIAVLSTIFNLPPDAGDRITLYDQHAEMLDLYDRLARAFAAYNGIPGISIVATEDISESLEGADAVFICLGLESRGIEVADADETARVEMLHDELSQVSRLLRRDGTQLVFNLTGTTSLTGTLLDAPAFHIDWPPPVPQEELYTFAHRALRLVRGDDPIFQPLQEFKENPLATAIMDSRPPPENRYDPEAASRLLKGL